MHPSIDSYPGIFSPRPYHRSQRTTFTFGCSCGRAESQTPPPQGQEECFSYVVSVDGVHVCYPQDTIDYESTGEDDIENEPQSIIEYEGTGEDGEDDPQSQPQKATEYEGPEEDASESNPQDLVELEDTGKDGTESNPRDRVECESTEAAALECERPWSLLKRRGKSLSGVRLALVTSTSSTLVNFSGGSPGESDVADHPYTESGRYIRTKLIGMDGEGIIHLMESRSASQFIVRKTVRYAKTAFAKPIEASILQDIFPDRHDNIIRLHAFEPYREEGARYYLEYCSGGDLHRLVEQYQDHELALPEPFIWQAYQQLASALEFLHRGFDPRCNDPNRRGICHRDIKPSNVFLRFARDSEYPEVVLADFGHATLDFATYDPAGTTIWQPPELPRHSPKGDVYSLGAVIHFLIHFDAPIAELPEGAPDTSSMKDAWALAPQARQPRMVFVDTYSEELICVMLIALEADENKRKNSSQLLKLLSDCIGQKFPSSSDLRRKAKEWPLATWAFDHMMPPRREEDDEAEGEETGMEQYYEMMERCGYCIMMEDSLPSSPALSDKRRRIVGKSPRASDMPSGSSLGEIY